VEGLALEVPDGRRIRLLDDLAGVEQSAFKYGHEERNVKPPSAEQLLKPDTNIGKMRRALYDLWRQHQAEGTLPTSARFFYYELITAGVISKTTKARSDGTKGRRSDQDMIDALTDLRKAGIIPWTDIVDETREFKERDSHRMIGGRSHSFSLAVC
jgi:hypothetical protein